MRNASIIVMDEPTSSLSEKGAQRLFEVVRELRQQGISIIYISHRLEEITGLADDITVLRDGRVVQSDSVKKMDIPQIVRYMVGRELTDLFPGRNVKLGEVCVQVQNLSSTQRVTDISFDIRAGEIVAMAGLVGAGRTEVAETIFGVISKIAGKIIIDGKEITINRPADAISNGIALLTEDRKRTGLCLQLPCSWNITLPNLGGIDRAAIIKPDKENKIAAEIAGRIGIKWLGPDAPAESLSGGNQQKLLIARWLLAKSRFMIFDEPTRGIDVGAKKEVYALLNRLAEQGKAILFISSELPELFGIADRILVMRRGRLVGNLKKSETTQEAVMHLAAVEGS
jgi:ABC-type sugar transport system ATPase subunit